MLFASVSSFFVLFPLTRLWVSPKGLHSLAHNTAFGGQTKQLFWRPWLDWQMRGQARAAEVSADNKGFPPQTTRSYLEPVPTSCFSSWKETWNAGTALHAFLAWPMTSLLRSIKITITFPCLLLPLFVQVIQTLTKASQPQKLLIDFYL